MEIELSPEHLRSGANELETVAENLQTCSDAVSSALPITAFGLFLGPIAVPAYGIMSFAFKTMVNGLAKEQTESVEDLRATAADAEATDQQIRDSLNQIGRAL